MNTFIINTDCQGDIKIKVDVIELHDGRLEVIKDHFIIAVFHKWNHYIKIESDDEKML